MLPEIHSQAIKCNEAKETTNIIKLNTGIIIFQEKWAVIYHFVNSNKKIMFSY